MHSEIFYSFGQIWIDLEWLSRLYFAKAKGNYLEP